MAERVFLHIGAPKTGTTFLQRVMDANHETMLEQGVLYATGHYPNDRIWASEIARGIDLHRHPKPYAADGWKRILRQVRSHDGTAVVSHEFFSACNESQARSVISELAPAQVHLVLTLRDYVRQEPAAWQERLKYGRTTVPLSEFTLDDSSGSPVWSWRTQDAVAILNRWSADRAPEHVHVVTVPPPGTGGNLLWDRFASVIGVDPESCDTELTFTNTSLGVVEAELLRRFDERLPEKFKDTRPAAAWVRDVLANEVLAARRGDRLTVAPARAHELANASREAAAAIAAAGYDVVGDLKDLVPESFRAGRAPEDVPESELLDAALDAIGSLLCAMDAREQQRKQRPQRQKRQKPRSLLAAARASDATSVRLARRALARARRLRLTSQEP